MGWGPRLGRICHWTGAEVVEEGCEGASVCGLSVEEEA